MNITLPTVSMKSFALPVFTMPKLSLPKLFKAKVVEVVAPVLSQEQRIATLEKQLLQMQNLVYSQEILRK